jgi:positive regulator of sigma E activity
MKKLLQVFIKTIKQRTIYEKKHFTKKKLLKLNILWLLQLFVMMLFIIVLFTEFTVIATALVLLIISYLADKQYKKYYFSNKDNKIKKDEII